MIIQDLILIFKYHDVNDTMMELTKNHTRLTKLQLFDCVVKARDKGSWLPRTELVIFLRTSLLSGLPHDDVSIIISVQLKNPEICVIHDISLVPPHLFALSNLSPNPAHPISSVSLSVSLHTKHYSIVLVKTIAPSQQPSICSLH